MSSFPMRDSRVLVGDLLGKIREKYRDRVEVNIYDPRCYLWFFDLVRFNVRATEVVWALDGKLLARGVPSWEELDGLIDARIGQ
ncbi:MAG: hypothetical protein JW971_03670 [Synergistales bacterium]|nr:hypothetical protein [Synergistales bacterium]